jgi:hypothetical protein
MNKDNVLDAVISYESKKENLKIEDDLYPVYDETIMEIIEDRRFYKKLTIEFTGIKYRFRD